MEQILELESFTPLVGQVLEVRTPEGVLELVLIEAKALKASHGAPRKKPFTLLFKAPKDCSLNQGMVDLAHEQSSPLSLFLVPINEDEEGKYYEAIFN